MYPGSHMGTHLSSLVWGRKRRNIEILRWNEWERLPESEEWMHFIRHDYLPEMCAGCARAAKCLGGCREAARVFLGSPSAPDPLLANGVERETGFS